MRPVIREKLIKVLLFGAVLFLISTIAQAQPKEPKYEGPIYQKPGRPMATFDVKVRSFDADGDIIKRYFITSPYFNIEMKTPTGWSRKKDPDTSISYYFRGNPQTTFFISLYSKKDFMPNIGPEHIKGYIEGLKLRHRNSIEILNDDGNYRPKVQYTWPLSKLNRVVNYTITDPGNGNKTKHYEYFLLVGDYLLV